MYVFPLPSVRVSFCTTALDVGRSLNAHFAELLLCMCLTFIRHLPANAQAQSKTQPLPLKPYAIILHLLLLGRGVGWSVRAPRPDRWRFLRSTHTNRGLRERRSCWCVHDIDRSPWLAAQLSESVHERKTTKRKACCNQIHDLDFDSVVVLSQCQLQLFIRRILN